MWNLSGHMLKKVQNMSIKIWRCAHPNQEFWASHSIIHIPLARNLSIALHHQFAESYGVMYPSFVPYDLRAWNWEAKRHFLEHIHTSLAHIHISTAPSPDQNRQVAPSSYKCACYAWILSSIVIRSASSPLITGLLQPGLHPVMAHVLVVHVVANSFPVLVHADTQTVQLRKN